ncbi:hypothetical protein RHMOL_Rhmol08G0328400 [Rhododendron molle]|uniref:Uncharacterized protein n=1 Tax=Rhododendron molle TaxID=49168 RepID=A0ACC0MX57_RHOML|nr:hypothetical protein RHMOL_Rhmol08G0328400 [Rhododendron molle]
MFSSLEGKKYLDMWVHFLCNFHNVDVAIGIERMIRSKNVFCLSPDMVGYVMLQLRKMLDLLVHASQCRSSLCQYPNCRKVKGLFRHGIQCKTRASGGCLLCKKMWYLLQLHARACKESECHVPRCRDLKEHMRRLQQQSDSRRRAAVMEMMRQRAAEVAGNAG